MSLPAGISVGQTGAATAAFAVKNPILQMSYPAGMAVGASAGAAVVRTGNAGELGLASDSSTVLAGILGHDVIDTAALPDRVKNNLFGVGLLGFNEVGQAASAWKSGVFQLTNVNGAVAYGEFVVPDTNGKWKTGTTTNTIKNGAIVCEEANTVSGGPIIVSVYLA